MNRTECIPAKTERRIIAQYVREVNKEIIATHKQKRKLFGDLKSDIHERIEDGKIATYEDIISHFGTPEQVAKDFFATADIKEIKKKLLVRRIIVVAIFTCVLVYFAYYSLVVDKRLDSIHRYVTETLEVDGSIVYEDNIVEDNRHDWAAILSH